MAFNLTVLANLLGTVLEPDFTGVDLLIEDVERASLPDRPDDVPCDRQPQRPQGCAAAARAGRRHTLQRPGFRPATKSRSSRSGAASGITFGGRADIGHDALNRVVPFRGEIDDFPSAMHCKAPLCALPDREQQEGQMAQRDWSGKQAADWRGRFNLRRNSRRSPEAIRFRAARSFRRCGITFARTTCKTLRTSGKFLLTTSCGKSSAARTGAACSR